MCKTRVAVAVSGSGYKPQSQCERGDRLSFFKLKIGNLNMGKCALRAGVTLSLTCEARHILTNHVYEVVFDLLVESDDGVEHGGTRVDNTGEFGIPVSSVCGMCVRYVCAVCVCKEMLEED